LSAPTGLDEALSLLWTLVDEAGACSTVGLFVRMVEWIAHRHREERHIMNHVVLHDVRASFFLMVGLAMLAFICAVAALSTVMRPARWADRKSSQL
jgi:Tfp pilus assembly protein PilN